MSQIFLRCFEIVYSCFIIWDDMWGLNKFLLVFSLKCGAYVISIVGLIYGFIGLVLFASMNLQMDHWKSVYASKMDEFTYFYFLLGFTIIVFIASIVSLIGIPKENDCILIIYLWCIVLHVTINWVLTICVSFYCLFYNKHCFSGAGHGQAVNGIIIAVFYSLLWYYNIVIINSFRVLYCEI